MSWKLFKEIGLYADPYGNLSPTRLDASTLDLDEIKFANTLCLMALKMATKKQPNVASFTMDAFKFLTEPLPKDFFEDLPPDADRVTSKKWWPHIQDLVKYGVIEPTEYKFLKHVAYYFGVPKKETLARAVWNGRTLSRSCRYPPPPVNLPFLPELIRRMIGVLDGGGSLCILTADFTNYFYLIPASEDMQRFCGICIEEVDEHGHIVRDARGNAKLRAYRFRVLVMGHSHSPWAAQSVGWAGILHKEDGEEDLFEVPAGLTQLPTFVKIKGGGFICLYYDNIFAVTVNPDIMQKIEMRLRRNFGPKDRGGFQFACNFMKVHYPKNLRNAATPAEYIGVEFSLSTKAQRDDIPVGTLRWRQCEKKHAKWIETPPQWADTMTPRYICSYIGKILWRHSITLRPLCGLAPVIRILRRVATFRIEKKCSWDAAIIDLTSEEQMVMAMHWDIVSRNLHESGSIASARKSHRVRVVSDSSDDGFGYLIFTDDGKVALEKGHLWSKSLNKNHIYIKELLAAVFAIRHVLSTSPKSVEINIGVDNTAAASSLRNMYSGNIMACEILDQLYTELQEHDAVLRVWSLRSDENASDPASRGKVAHDELVDECFRVMLGQEQGHRINVPATYIQHGETVRHPEYEEWETPIESLLFAEDALTGEVTM